MTRSAVYICGHGGWTPEMGYASVPRGCCVNFYTESSKTILSLTINAILASEAIPLRTVAEFRFAQNVCVSPFPLAMIVDLLRSLQLHNERDPGAILYLPTHRKSLNAIMSELRMSADVPMDFHWLSCLSTTLRKVGGIYSGINVQDSSIDMAIYSCDNEEDRYTYEENDAKRILIKISDIVKWRLKSPEVFLRRF